MMREVVDDRDPARLADHLLPARDAAERLRTPSEFLRRATPNALSSTYTPSAFATFIRPPIGSRTFSAMRRPPRAIANRAPPESTLISVARNSPALETESQAARFALRSLVSIAAGESAHTASTRFRIQLIGERAKRRLHVIEIAIDVGVIEFHRSDDRAVRRGNEETSAPCRKRRCRTRRPR